MSIEEFTYLYIILSLVIIKLKCKVTSWLWSWSRSWCWRWIWWSGSCSWNWSRVWSWHWGWSKRLSWKKINLTQKNNPASNESVEEKLQQNYLIIALDNLHKWCTCGTWCIWSCRPHRGLNSIIIAPWIVYATLLARITSAGACGYQPRSVWRTQRPITSWIGVI